MSFVGIILSIVILGLLILIHEFGHYIVAKKNNVMVKEFSIGFGPRIISWGKGETKFSWKAIPFGGSCQMLGQFEDEDDETDNERSYDKKSVWARMSICIAGPLFNFLLAFVLAVITIGTVGYDPATVTLVEEGTPAYEAGIREGDVLTNFNGAVVDFGRDVFLENYVHPIDSADPVKISYVRDGKKYDTTLIPAEYEYYTLGISYMATEDRAEIVEVAEGSATEAAGLQAGDVIRSVNGVQVSSGLELSEYFSNNAVSSEPLEIEYSHKGYTKTTTVLPVAQTAYKVGIGYNLQNEKTDALGVLKYSFCEIRYQITSVFKSIGFLFSGRGSLDMLSGPVGIVQIVGETYDASVSYGFVTTLMNLFSIIILLSANLGVINLLPLPALDGGKILLLIIEAIRRKPVNKKFEGVITVVFAVLLMILAVVVLVNDITKFF